MTKPQYAPITAGPDAQGQALVEWIVSRYHVSMNDEEVRAEWQKRLDKHAKASKSPISAEIRELWCDHAVVCHQKNIELFDYVARGGY